MILVILLADLSQFVVRFTYFLELIDFPVLMSLLITRLLNATLCILYFLKDSWRSQIMNFCAFWNPFFMLAVIVIQTTKTTSIEAGLSFVVSNIQIGSIIALIIALKKVRNKFLRVSFTLIYTTLL